MMFHLVVFCFAVGAGGVSGDLLRTLGRGLQQEIASAKAPVVETVVTIGSSQCTNVKKLIGVDYEQIEGVKEPDLNQLSLKYITPALNVSFNINSVSQAVLQADPQKLVIFVHGFTDDPGRSSYGNISQAFLSRGMYNVLALDGSSLIRWLYLRSTTYVRFMGEKLGSILATMVQAGYDPSNIHIIGHSLGAHISGFTGKQFSQLTGRRVGRITGLDPAGPCFSHVDPGLRLEPTDAEFVDVIHTDAGVYGIDDTVGQVDFYPNSGSQQPNCLFDTCSHSRAWQYFAESIVHETAFPALRCKSWDAFKKGDCDKDVSYMGLSSTPGTKGQYYLQTGEDPPFSLGKAGTVYKNNEGILKNLFGKK